MTCVYLILEISKARSVRIILPPLITFRVFLARASIRCSAVSSQADNVSLVLWLAAARVNDLASVPQTTKRGSGDRGVYLNVVIYGVILIILY